MPTVVLPARKHRSDLVPLTDDALFENANCRATHAASDFPCAHFC